jgi:hypothetical protein
LAGARRVEAACGFDFFDIVEVLWDHRTDISCVKHTSDLICKKNFPPKSSDNSMSIIIVEGQLIPSKRATCWANGRKIIMSKHFKDNLIDAKQNGIDNISQVVTNRIYVLHYQVHHIGNIKVCYRSLDKF